MAAVTVGSRGRELLLLASRMEGLTGVTAIDVSTGPPPEAVRNATICMIHGPEDESGAVAL